MLSDFISGNYTIYTIRSFLNDPPHHPVRLIPAVRLSGVGPSVERSFGPSLRTTSGRIGKESEGKRKQIVYTWLVT